jgi:2-polyprenyl-3-methyl-5-hydroxy-6-metoxy-1,4-benzoquinol methylase
MKARDEEAIFRHERAASEENYREHWRPRELDASAFYRKYAQPLNEGGNNHRYPAVKAQLDALLRMKGKRILDCACGAGELAIWLAGTGAEVWGFDFSEQAIKVAERSAAMSRVGGRVRFAVMDARALEYESDFFDAITGQDCLHHLIKYPAGIRELARVLKPGGRGLFVEPLAWNPAINVLRAANVRLRGRVGEHMLRRADVAALEAAFGELRVTHHSVISALSRLVADTHRPISAPASQVSLFLLRLDRIALARAPWLERFAACAHLELVKSQTRGEWPMGGPRST